MSEPVFKFTKIVATIGPSCTDAVILEKMVKAGMNIARLNFSHGNYESHSKCIELIRAVEKKTGEPVAILQDLQGPHIRIGAMPKEGLPIEPGQTLVFNANIKEYEGKEIPVSHPEVHKFIKVGERVLIDDGKIEVKVTKIEKTHFSAEVVEGKLILSHKGINLPDSEVTIPALGEKDRADLRFGIMSGVDIVALSFVSSAADIHETRKLIDQIISKEKLEIMQPIFIVAKIERRIAMQNLEEIIAAADGIMVARGDLGLELPAAEVPLAQKRMISLCNTAGKPVIVATQMLASMVDNSRPTRAEVSDIANAVIDHADAVMLSNETASGKYPVEAVAIMAEVCVATEQSGYDDVDPSFREKTIANNKAVSDIADLLTDQVGAKLIVTSSLTGKTGRLISQVRPNLPIIVGTNQPRTERQLNLSWGVHPFLLPSRKKTTEIIDESIAYVQKTGLAKKGEKIIVVGGDPAGQPGLMNVIEVRQL